MTRTQPVMPRPSWWPYRYYLAACVVLLVAVVVWVLWPRCGNGLRSPEDGSSDGCVGLNLDSTSFGAGEEFTKLEKILAKQNADITGDYVTIVLLDNLTPDPSRDSVAVQTVQHAVAGAITGQWRANHTPVANGSGHSDDPQKATVKIKLLLANYGSQGSSAQQAVDAIIEARNTEHIVAVTDFGQSLQTTRKAASDLSDAHIAVVASLVTGDDMNLGLDGQPIERFHRIAANNTQQAEAAVSTLPPGGNVVLVEDTNRSDNYARSLAIAFTKSYAVRFPTQPPPNSVTYRSPDEPLNDSKRRAHMTNMLGGSPRLQICLNKPDVLYFAGRGVDLSALLAALAKGGDCNLKPMTIVTGDDATAILGSPVPMIGSASVTVVYTGEATVNQWNGSTPEESAEYRSYARNYQDFVSAFTGRTLGAPKVGAEPDLPDGYAMVNHDAVLTAATAARSVDSAVNNPGTVADAFTGINCNAPVAGASGPIAFSKESNGNATHRPVPLIMITPSGGAVPQRLLWPTGKPQEVSTRGCR
ncbi:ABC transporter substrate-binding protein [Pseudonocardia spinosispora]|uniref:ABC transporter substrate-binding protein n=1 Tax=Pseudonocardia spinosispora TaxID=103441 RepID=UPI00040B4775|nr:hypothetical protein [Pseudonocardia spinosispora]